MTPSPGDLVSWREVGLSPTGLEFDECIGIVIRSVDLEEYVSLHGLAINPDELETVKGKMAQVEILHNGKIVRHFTNDLKLVYS
jgi:hypothetical protein